MGGSPRDLPSCRLAFTLLQMMIPVRFRHMALAAPLGAWMGVATVQAQTPAGRPTGETARAELAARARVADSLGRHQEAYLLRTRLRTGDFQVGDRILVSYEGPGLTKRDTLIVQAGRVVRLGEPLGDLEVGGVLRFEIQQSVQARVDSLFKNEVVHVTPLVRLAISGAVHAPGFYHVPADVPLGDVIMRNAGQEATTDLNKIEIRRGQQVLWARKDVEAALTNGLTVEALNLEPGDEIVVGARSPTRWWGLAQVATAILGVAVLVAQIAR